MPAKAPGLSRALGNGAQAGTPTATVWPPAVSLMPRLLARRLDQLARQIAGDSNSEIILELARSAAEAEFDLASRSPGLGGSDQPRVRVWGYRPLFRRTSEG